MYADFLKNSRTLPLTCTTIINSTGVQTMDSIASVANAAVALQQQKMAQQINLAVMNKAQDVQKQQGEAAFQLLNSTPGNSSRLDVYA
jgi:hypothetical protein